MDITDIKGFIEERLRTDGYLEPHVFIFTKENCIVAGISDMLQENDTRSIIVDKVAMIAEDKEAHKVIFITEAWFYTMDKNLSESNMIEMLENEEEYKDQLDKREAYQIIELTKFNVNSILREIIKTDDTVLLGEEIESSGVQLHIYKPIQDSLSTLM